LENDEILVEDRKLLTQHILDGRLLKFLYFLPIITKNTWSQQGMPVIDQLPYICMTCADGSFHKFLAYPLCYIEYPI